MSVRNKLMQITVTPLWLTHAVGGALVIAGVLFWGTQLIAFPERRPPPEPTRKQAADPAGENVARWLGAGEIRLNVVVNGVMVRPGRAVALLSINDEPPAPYMVGEKPGHDLRVQSIDRDRVVLNNAGREVVISAPERDVVPDNLIILSSTP